MIVLQAWNLIQVCHGKTETKKGYFDSFNNHTWSSELDGEASNVYRSQTTWKGEHINCNCFVKAVNDNKNKHEMKEYKMNCENIQDQKRSNNSIYQVWLWVNSYFTKYAVDDLTNSILKNDLKKKKITSKIMLIHLCSFGGLLYARFQLSFGLWWGSL